MATALRQPGRATYAGGDLPKGRQLCQLGVRDASWSRSAAAGAVGATWDAPAPAACPTRSRSTAGIAGAMQGAAVGKRKILPYLKGSVLCFCWDRTVRMKQQIMVQHIELAGLAVPSLDITEQCDCLAGATDPTPPTSPLQHSS